MNIIHLGTEYGGWQVDIDSIHDGDLIIDAGLGEDISFIERLSQIKKVKIVGVDPTIKSHLYVESKNMTNLSLLKKAIHKKGVEKITMFRNSNPNYVSESYLSDHSSVFSSSYDIECVSFKELIETYNPTLIKMDIEGGEYDVLSECIGVKQVCVEFHHHCIDSKSFKDTIDCINMMESNDYRIIANRNNIEFTFLKKSL